MSAPPSEMVSLPRYLKDYPCLYETALLLKTQGACEGGKVGKSSSKESSPLNNQNITALPDPTGPEIINEFFKKPENKKDKTAMEILWRVLKEECLHRYGNLESAFRGADASGEGGVSYVEFDQLLRRCGIHLESRLECYSNRYDLFRFGRTAFKQGAMNQTEMTFELFQATLMKSTLNMIGKQLQQLEKNRKKVRKLLTVNILLYRYGRWYHTFYMY